MKCKGLIITCFCVLSGCGTAPENMRRPVTQFEEMNRATSISNGRVGQSGLPTPEGCRYSSKSCSTEPTSFFK